MGEGSFDSIDQLQCQHCVLLRHGACAHIGVNNWLHARGNNAPTSLRSKNSNPLTPPPVERSPPTHTPCNVYGFDETCVVVACSPKMTAKLDKNNNDSVVSYACRRSVSVRGRGAPWGLLLE